jgi:Mg-chelatase subunit ChlD
MSRFRYRSAVTFVVAVAALVVAAPAFAVDNFTPAVVNTTLQAGQSTTINKTLHLDALPGAADIIIAIDTTGSMTDAIAQAKAQATALCTNVQAQIPGARFAVIDFKDIPDRPATNGVLILTPVFTSSCAAVLAAVNTMSADGGGDFAEAYNPTFRAAWSNATLNASRNPNAVQFLVVLGDAPPHNSPAASVAPTCGNQPPADPGMTSNTEIASLNAAEITLLMIRYATPGAIALGCYTELATATGGTAVNGGADLSGDIISQIQEAAAHIDEVRLVVSGVGCQTPAGLRITFTPPNPPPYGPFTAPVNINFQETILAPTLPGNYSCTVTAIVDGTVRATQTVNATVTPGLPATLTLTPDPDTNPLGTQHCVTAHVVDQFGNPTPGRTVRFSVSGVGTGSGAVVTNASGDAQFCYIGPLAPVGDDTITAFADTNLNGVDDGASEPNDSALKHWIDITPPTGSCSQGPNPAGHTPPAGNNPHSGQNPDGFYVLNVTDNADPNPQIFIHDSDSAAVFGPFANGTTIKLTQAPGATPSQKPGTGDVDWKIKLKGDAELFFVDASGNTSGPVTCLVPPPPK